MSIHKTAAGPWGCGDLDALALFLGAGNDTNLGGRNRYHCSYVVYALGTRYYAENGTTGKIDFGGLTDEGAVSGLDATAVIEAAMGALTAGRTWKETVVLKGNFTITTAIDVPSYTTLVIDARIFPLTDINAIQIHGTPGMGNNKVKIDIIGGSIYGMWALASTLSGVSIQYADYITLTRVTIREFNIGLRVEHSYIGCSVVQCDIANNFLHNVLIDDTNTWNFLASRISGQTNAVGASIRIQNLSGVNIISGCTIEGNAGQGVFIYDAHTNTVCGNYIGENDGLGYYESYVTASTQFVGSNTVERNLFTDNDATLLRAQVYVHASIIDKIKDNYFLDTALVYAQGAIWLAVGAVDTLVSGNRHNVVAGAMPFISDAGIRTKIHENPTYVTENSGTATFSGDGTTTVFQIPHGCNITPTHVSLEAETAGAVGDKHWSADGVNITVTFITAPPTGVNNIIIGWKGEFWT